MTVNVSNFCYGDNSLSKLDALFAVKTLFERHTTATKPNYIPVPDKGEYPWVVCISAPVMFVSVKSLTPAMRAAFQNCENLGASRVISQLNGTVYDYAVKVVKELLVDEDVDVAKTAIEIASEHRLCSMSRMTYGYHVLRDMQFASDSAIKECGKMLHDAIR